MLQSTSHAQKPHALRTKPPQLPPLESLTPASDFTPFLHPAVGEDVRRAALKTLFSDPHFNVMDGLDVYIDDYSKPDPIPAAMLASLKQARRILTWAEGKDDETAAAEAEPVDGSASESRELEAQSDAHQSVVDVTPEADRVAKPK